MSGKTRYAVRMILVCMSISFFAHLLANAIRGVLN